ncbi:hypothetical protein TCDM_08754 [Trypanosoma cruzi Dm28c]|uniref:Uncharacterized protein n=1 Tax=Trypanosoma cruzi Dm28c TaxID=1416333 RepID=V5B748_TRYCR|nr:hypothetical protein TCDM_08754 [Trypanosoma cruzi Dm28c]
MHTRRERSVVSAPLTEGTHTQEEAQRTQQHNSKVTMKRRDPRTPRGLLVHGKCSQYPSQKQFSCHRPSFIFSANNFMQVWEQQLQQRHAYVKIRSKRWELVWETAVVLSLSAVVAVHFSLLVNDVVVNSYGCLTRSDEERQLFS